MYYLSFDQSAGEILIPRQFGSIDTGLQQGRVHTRPGSHIFSSDGSDMRKIMMEAIELPAHETPCRQWSFPLPRRSGQMHLPIPGPTVKLQRNSASRQESSNKATKICTRWAEKFPGLPIQVKNHVCSGCRREFFNRNDLHDTAKTGRSKNALLCGYSANSCLTMTKLEQITIFLFQRWCEMIKEERSP